MELIADSDDVVGDGAEDTLRQHDGGRRYDGSFQKGDSGSGSGSVIGLHEREHLSAQHAVLDHACAQVLEKTGDRVRRLGHDFELGRVTPELRVRYAQKRGRIGAGQRGQGDVRVDESMIQSPTARCYQAPGW